MQLNQKILLFMERLTYSCEPGPKTLIQMLDSRTTHSGPITKNPYIAFTASELSQL